jgi:microcystin-dependent protein
MEAYIGMITIFAGNFAPNGWMLCQGQTLSIAQNAALFSILGTTYGGNGQTTFALPDLRGTVPVSQGQARSGTTYTLGETGGSENATITVNQMPPHLHNNTVAVSIGVNDGRADGTAPNGATLASTESNAYAAAPDGTSKLNAQAISATVTNALAGGGQPTPVMQPYLAINYIICVEGLFPSRN